MGVAILLLLVSVILAFVCYLGLYKAISYSECFEEKHFKKMRIFNLILNLLFSLAIAVLLIIGIIKDNYNLLAIGIILGVQFIIDLIYAICFSIIGYKKHEKDNN